MIFPECKLFRDIAQLRSVSRGAAANGVSQSAASQHVQDLERRLGKALLDRSTRPWVLTDAGRLYLDLCRDALRLEERFEVALEHFKGLVEGSVRVASIYSVGLSEMSRLQEEFAARFPSAQLHVEYMRPDKLYEALLLDNADVGLVSYPEPSRDLTVIPWRAERMTVASSPSNKLARKRSLHPADLDGQHFIAFDEDLPIRKELDRFLRDAGVAVTVVMQFDNIQMVKEAVALGQGISILPSRTMQTEIDQGRLVSIPLHAPELVRPVGIVHRKRKKLNRATESFLELLEGELPPA